MKDYTFESFSLNDNDSSKTKVRFTIITKKDDYHEVDANSIKFINKYLLDNMNKDQIIHDIVLIYDICQSYKTVVKNVFKEMDVYYDEEESMIFHAIDYNYPEQKIIYNSITGTSSILYLYENDDIYYRIFEHILDEIKKLTRDPKIKNIEKYIDIVNERLNNKYDDDCFISDIKKKYEDFSIDKLIYYNHTQSIIKGIWFASGIWFTDTENILTDFDNDIKINLSITTDIELYTESKQLVYKLDKDNINDVMSILRRIVLYYHNTGGANDYEINFISDKYNLNEIYDKLSDEYILILNSLNIHVYDDIVEFTKCKIKKFWLEEKDDKYLIRVETK